MSFYSKVEYNDQTWSYVWVNPAPGLDNSVKDDLISQIIDMYHDGDDIRHIEQEHYGARIVKRGKKNLGMFFGNYFDAEFETEESKSKLSILLLDVKS